MALSRADIFHGPDAVLDRLVAAARGCGLQEVRKDQGSHLEPIVAIEAPKPDTAGHRCVMAWAQAHTAEGLTNQFAPGY